MLQGMTRELAGSGAPATDVRPAVAPAQAKISSDASRVTVLARDAGRGATLGVLDASQGVLTLTMLGLALLAMGLLGWTLLRARRDRTQRAREDAITLLASMVRSAEGTPWGDELRERIRHARQTQLPAGGE